MSHTQVQLGRGTSAQIAAYTGPQGEVSVNTDDFSLVLHDGATAGGKARLTPGISPPQGRLTLTSATPVMASDVTAAATVYYTPYVGDCCPIFNGTVWQVWEFAETSLALDNNSGHAGYQATGDLYDLFAFSNGGSFALGTGPAWLSASSRGTGAGTTQLQMLNGRWVNAAAVTLRFGNAGGNTASVGANQATYLGTLYATANGQTAMQFAPAAVAGGSGNILGLYNAYNRVLTRSFEQDSTSSWTYGTTTWRVSNNSVNNRISWVDGLGQSAVEAHFLQDSLRADLGLAFNSITATPNPIAEQLSTSAETTGCAARFMGAGLNYAQQMEYARGTPSTFYGNGYQALQVSLEM